MTGNWNASGATEDTTYYHEKFNWFNSKTISISPFMQGGKVREALETNKSRALNEKDRTFKALIEIGMPTLVPLLGNHYS